MEFKGQYHGADVYDDYAHHPDELAATINAVRAAMPSRRLVLAFQPHTYTRTKALFDDFVRELKKPDVVVLAGAEYDWYFFSRFGSSDPWFRVLRDVAGCHCVPSG